MFRKKFFLLLIIVHVLLFCEQKPIFLFAHGIFDSKKQAEGYKKILGNRVLSFNFQDALTLPWLHKPFTTCFAQKVEVEKLAKVHAFIVNFFRSRSLLVPPIILVGVSRGASVILNFLAIKNPNDVEGVILESPFDHLEYTIEVIFGKQFSWSQRLFRPLFSLIFPFYDRQGAQPIFCVAKIKGKVPMLFITSLSDKTVEHYATLSLYRICQKLKHKVFLKVFLKGDHAKIARENEAVYVKVVQDFLKELEFSAR